MPLRLPRLPPPSAGTLAFAELWSSLTDVAVAGLGLLVAINAWAPAQDLPWKPLSLTAPLGMATGMKFARAAADPALCRKVLTEGGVTFAEAPRRENGYCSTANTLRLGSGTTALAPAAPLQTCSLALGYAFWDRHVVQPAAERAFGRPLSAVSHFGTYACRRIYNRAQAPASEHASADAIDVSGFRLSDGRRITVAGDFRKTGAEGRFVREVRDGACRWFHGVLSPDYNAAHRDHLHLDFGAYRICR